MQHRLAQDIKNDPKWRSMSESRQFVEAFGFEPGANLDLSQAGD